MISQTIRHNTKLMLVDDLSPEDIAMLQALYSRSAESAESHIEKIKTNGSGKFMSQYYVGYGHKSIADCGTTTLFIENVSLLAAKAIQDWPLYCGQETSTRYIDMSKQHIVDPVDTIMSRIILQRWMEFYTSKQDQVSEVIRKRHPPKPEEKLETYEKAVKARTFDVMRGFLPAGISTQLSWHTNLRQAGDHLVRLTNHPSEEIREITQALEKLLAQQYPSSGFGQSLATVSGENAKDKTAAAARAEWEKKHSIQFSYPTMPWVDEELFGDFDMDCRDIGMLSLDDMKARKLEFLNTRPKGCVLPHFLTELGCAKIDFLLDFGSFRDIQRHRNGVCKMPILTTAYGFEDWYLEQLGPELRVEAEALIAAQIRAIADIRDPVVRQYYVALGFKVQTAVTYALPALIYVMELRSGKSIHPTLRKRILQMTAQFQLGYPDIALHVDTDPDDWDIRRGLQTITQK